MGHSDIGRSVGSFWRKAPPRARARPIVSAAADGMENDLPPAAPRGDIVRLLVRVFRSKPGSAAIGRLRLENGRGLRFADQDYGPEVLRMALDELDRGDVAPAACGDVVDTHDDAMQTVTATGDSKGDAGRDDHLFGDFQHDDQPKEPACTVVNLAVVPAETGTAFKFVPDGRFLQIVCQGSRKWFAVHTLTGERAALPDTRGAWDFETMPDEQTLVFELTEVPSLSPGRS